MQDFLYDLLWTPHWWDRIAGLVVVIGILYLSYLGLPDSHKP